MPGYGNTIRDREGNYMTNWWLFTADWDRAIRSDIGLYSAEPIHVFRLQIGAKSLADGTYRHVYSDSVTAEGGYAPYTWSIGSGELPDGLVLNPETGIIAGTPTRSGTFDFTVVVTDAQMVPMSDTAGFAITIRNHAPRFVSADWVSVRQGDSLSYTARAVDPDQNTISYAFADYPSWLSPADSSIAGVPNKGAVDTSFAAVASDGELADTLMVHVQVIAVNEPPEIINLTDFTFVNDQTYAINLDTCVTDPDDAVEALSWQITPADSNLYVTITGRVASFTAAGWAGATEVLFKVTDPAGAADSLSVKATVEYPVGVTTRGDHVPNSFFLGQNYPNPFNATTTIFFGLPRPARVKIGVFNLLGEKVTDLFSGWKQAGYYRLTWQAEGRASGVYLIKMEGAGFMLTRKCVLLK